MRRNPSIGGGRPPLSLTPHGAARVEPLERRQLLSAAAPVLNILTHHVDAANDGGNTAETVLSPTNVNPADFGKQWTATLDGGVVAAEPLYMQDVAITSGPAAGVHSVVYAGTLADGLYALDANTGSILWHDSFLNTTDPTNLTPTAGVAPIRSTDIAGNTDVGTNIGILATPAVDPATGTMFVTTNTREVRGSDTHFVQRLWAVSIHDGHATQAPAVIGDTIANGGILGNFTYVSGPIVAGTGNNNPANPAAPTYPNTDRWLSAPGGRSGSVIAFNAILQMERPAVTLVGGNIYLAFASHGDDGPYYGWVLGYRESNLSMFAAFNAIPTYGTNVDSSQPYVAEAGVWMSGANIATDGTYLYLTTGNGAFNGAAANFNAAGFPIDGDYGDSLLKLAIDPGSTPTNQNGNLNGFGLKVADYFTPSNQYEMNQLDLDLGSGGVTLLPNQYTDPAGHPELMVGGKEARYYLLDRANLGKFNTSYPQGTETDPRLYDRALGEYADNGINAQGGNNNDHLQVYSSPTVYNGNVYVGFQGGNAMEFGIGAFATPGATGTAPLGTAYTPTPIQTTNTFGYPGVTLQASSNGDANGVIWAVNTDGNQLMAYDAANFGSTGIYSSNTNGADNVTGGVVKFSLPTVANGMVYVGTNAGTLIGYGLQTSYLSATAGAFAAPSGLTAAASADGVNLTWTSNSSLATEFRIDRFTDASGWTPLTYTAGAGTAYDDATAAPDTKYLYRVTALNGADATAASPAVTYAPPLTLAGPNAYLRLDADGQHVDVWNATTNAGPAAASLLLSQLSGVGAVGGSLASLTVDFSKGDPLPAPGGLTFAGTAGAGALTLVGDAGTNVVTVNATTVTVTGTFGTVPINYTGASSITFVSGSGSDTLTQAAQPGGGAVLAFANTTAADTLDVNAGTFALPVPNGGTAPVADILNTLSVGAGATVSMGGGGPQAARGVLVVNALNLAGTPGHWTGTLDLAGDNDLIVHSGSLATLTAQVGQGQTTGVGGILNSALAVDPTHRTAVGVALNQDLNGQPLYGTGTALGTFDGQNPGTADVLARSTYFGDTNLDGVVNGADYSRIDAGYIGGLTGWANGDFNYDGTVDGSDYTLTDNAFNMQGPAAPTGVAIVSAAQTVDAGSNTAQITARLLDAAGNAAVAPAVGLTIQLASSSPTGVFRDANGAGVPLTALTFPAGVSQVTFTYRDTTPGTPMLFLSAAGLATGRQAQTVTLSPSTTASALGFSSVPQSFSAGVTSATLVVNLLNAAGAAVTAPAGGVTVTLATTSATGTFVDASGNPITSITIPATSAKATFRYRDTAPGVPVLTTSAPNLTPALQQVSVASVAAALAFATPPRTAATSVASGPVTIGLVDGAGNSVPAAAGGVTVTLSTSSATGAFVSAAGATVTSVVIPAGATSATVEYRDARAGTPTLTASTAGLTSANQAATVRAATVLPAGTVAYYTFADPTNPFRDSSGNGNNLTVGGGTVAYSAAAPAGHGGSAAFANNGYLVTASGSFPNGVPTGGGAYTIAAWINTNTLARGGIVGWGNYGTYNQVNAFRTVGGDGGATNDGAGLDNYWWANDDVQATPLLLDNWAYVAVTYDGASTRTIYVNGNAVGTFSGSGFDAQVTNFRVGSTDFGEFFSGNISDLLINKTALSATQIQSLYAGGD